MQLFQFRQKGLVQIGLQFGKRTGEFGINLTKTLLAFQRRELGREHPAIDRMDTLLEEYLELDDMAKEMVTFASRYGEEERLFLAEEPEILAPLQRPGKILCIGQNYAKHAAETGSKPPATPVYFGKVADCIIGPRETIMMPRRFGRVDPEIELAVVIGKPGFQVPRDQAMDMVAGYTILNDVTARDVQNKAKDQGMPWFASKNYASFCPMGPNITLKQYVHDPHDLEMTLSVNGEVRQQENTGQMVFDIPHLIETLSWQLPLRPGDVIATGTPHGIQALADGDLLEMRIDGLGCLKNAVREIQH